MTVQGTFGKYKRQIIIFVFMCYQLCMVPLGFLSMYALLTLNLTILTPLILICILQYPVKKSETFVSLIRKHINPTDYFNKFTRISQEKISQNEKTFFGFHPHSIFSISILLNMNRNDDGIPDFIGLGSRFGFNAPILGMLLRLWGCSTVYSQNLKSLMKQGKNVGLVPGGYEQASLTSHNQMRLYLKQRKGFIKYALRYGYTLRPVLCFGQNKAFQTLDILNSLKLFLNKFKMPIAFFMNKKYLFFINPQLQITTVIGKGIKKQITQDNYQPTPQQIDKYHNLYIQEVKRIYNKYKSLNDDKPLVIV